MPDFESSPLISKLVVAIIVFPPSTVVAVIVVSPAATAVTKPLELIVATDTSEELHVIGVVPSKFTVY